MLPRSAAQAGSATPGPADMAEAAPADLGQPPEMESPKPAAGLTANQSVLTPEQFTFAKSLETLGQAHLFDGWPAPGTADADKVGLIEQLQAADEKYGGGIVQYIHNARKLLADSAAGVDPFKGYSPTIPAGMTVTAHTEEWETTSAAGLAVVGECAFMLVAGGLGERLGYGGIKVALPTEISAERKYMQLYIETILAYQAHARKASGDDSLTLPLAVMTSADTDDRTRELLAANANFGMAEGQITLLKQGKVPSIQDNDGCIALDASGYRVQTKPHGHGDVHSLLHMSGTVKSWIGAGKKYMFIFQDTNAFALQSCLIGLGVSVAHDFDMNSLCVPRKPGEAIGGICNLGGEGLPDLTINVEYNQIDAMLRATEEFKDGDVADPGTGFSPWPGNINELIFKLASYDAALDASGGNVPEFVNPKYKDETKTAFKSPTRLECMMQDFPRLYKSGEKCGFTSVSRAYVRQYSPVKNNVADAAKKQGAGLEPACASAGEFDVYRFNCDLLNHGGSGMAIGDSIPAEFLGIQVQVGPAVSLHPAFILGSKDKVVGGSIAAGSTLILDGEDITLKNVHVDGCLIVRAAPGAKVVLENLTIKNEGWSFVALSEEELAAAEEWAQIRGYKVAKAESKL